MRRTGATRRFDESAQDGIDDADDGGAVGPQGAALILELQRLQDAFDDETSHRPRGRGPSRDGLELDPRRRNGLQKKRKRKSKVEQAIDICLQPFRQKASAPPPGRRDPAPRVPTVPPPRRHSPSIAPDEPLPKNQARRRPTMPGPPMPGPALRGSTMSGSAMREPAMRGPGMSGPAMRGPAMPGPAMREPEMPGPATRGPAMSGPAMRGPTMPGPSMRGPAMSGSDQMRQPMLLAPPDAARADKAETRVGEVIERCRAGLTTGVRFLLHGGDPVPAIDGQGESMTSRVGRAFEYELRTGLRVLIIAAVLVGGWLVFVPLAGAVVVPGNLVVQSNVKQIQHPTGGVVAEIKVQNGARVSAGDLLVRLDATQAQASLEVVSKQLDEIRARMARLIAERDGFAEIQFPAELLSRAGNDDIKSLMDSEVSLFKARAGARQSQKDLLQSQIGQLSQQISGFESQLDSKARQSELIKGELTGVQDLYDKRLVPLTRLTTLQREAAQIDGEHGQMTSSIAETKSKIDSSQLSIVRIDQDFRAEVVKDLNEAQAKEAELAEHSIAARDQLDRIEIRAPTSGVVNQLSIHTIGGVVKAGETIMEIVPDSDDLQVEARVQPNDIDHVKTGQQAFVRFSAFNSRTTPQLKGTVSYVSADTGHDAETHTAFFTVRVVLPEEERRKLNGQQLVAGMPAEVFMQTGSRTMMNYLFEPITDQLRRAFVEQ
jgi:HlyD family secretion protein